MRRWSLRLRLTIVFTAAIALALTATGFAIRGVYRAAADRELDNGLSSRATELSALLSEARATDLADALERVSEEHERFAQVLAPSGALLAATPAVADTTLLTAKDARDAVRGTVTIPHDRVPRLHELARVQAIPARTADANVIVVVGATLGPGKRELATLTLLLALGGGITLLVASAASYGVAAGALRPVEAMHRRAASILPGEPGQRLPVPPSGDEVARLGTTLNEMLERTDAAFLRERVFVSDASHQLRTPLAILRAEIKLALKDGRSPEQLHAALESAGEETDRLSLLVADLLTLGKLDEGALGIRATVSAGEILEEVGRREYAAARARGLVLLASAPPRLRLACDRARVEQAVCNLVENALRFAVSEVSLGVRERTSSVELHVSDDGPGFTPEMRAHAFDRFTRGPGEPAGTGFGLGLAIVEAVARAHGGRAHIGESESGGADVWLELPIGVPLAEPAAVSA